MVDAFVPGQDAAAEKSPSVATDIPEIDLKAAGYGLRQEAVSPLETLAQSISSMCRTLTAIRCPSLSVYAGGKWHVARVNFSYGRDPSCRRLVHRPLCPLFLLTGLSLFLCRNDPADVARGYGRVEFGVGLCRGKREQYMGFLLLRQRDAEFHHRGFILFCCRPFTHLSEAISIFQMLIWFLLQVFRK
jgi:hypothetical protein